MNPRPRPIATTWQSTMASRAGRIALSAAVIVLVAIFHFTRRAAINAGDSTTVHDSDMYKRTPMCNPSGQCGESPDVPSPRTVYSAKTREQYSLWWEAHAALNRSALEYASARRTNENEKRTPLVLLGDSITESWLGTNMGEPEGRAEGVPEVLLEIFSGDFDPLVLAIGGDQTQHLLYRLRHGELLPEYADDPESIFVVLIGTNNLGSGILPGPTADGVRAVADYLLSQTKGMMVLLQLLPRGDSHRLKWLCPPRCDSHGQPFKSFMPAVDKVNAAIGGDFAKEFRTYGSRFRPVDCGQEFLPTRENSEDGAVEVDEGLMPDRLHPNKAGHRILAKCILGAISNKS